MSPAPPERIDLFGVPVDVLTRHELIARVAALVQARHPATVS
ncbi:MAG: hypothetical protein ABIO70_23385 [Pseudomonadota bacterium]